MGLHSKRCISLVLTFVLIFGILIAPSSTNTVLAADSGSQTIYYFSVEGNDSNDGTTQDKPKKSLEEAVKLMQAGTTILLKRGDSWYDESGAVMEINDKIGTEAAPIIVDAYGTGDAPLIANMKQLDTGWTNLGNNQWSCDVSSYGSIHRCFVNESPVASVALADLDQATEFTLDNGILYLYSESAPANVRVIFKCGAQSVSASNVHYLYFRNIAFKGGTWTTAYVNPPSTRVTFDHCSFTELGDTAIALWFDTVNKDAINQSPVISNCYMNKGWSTAMNSLTLEPKGEAVVCWNAGDSGLISGNTMIDFGHSAVYLRSVDAGYHGTKNFIIEKNEIYLQYSNYGRGFDIQGSEGQTRDNIIRQNYIHGMKVPSHLLGDNNKVYSNIIVDNAITVLDHNQAGYAIDLIPWGENLVCHDNIIANNTIVDTEQSCIRVNDAAVGQNTFKNNIFKAWEIGTIKFNAAIEVNLPSVEQIVENNCVWNGSTSNTAFTYNKLMGNAKYMDAQSANYNNNIQADPLFVNEAAGDYSLKANSPANTSGQALTGMGEGFTDYYGNAWNPVKPSIGAVQFQGVPEEPTLPPDDDVQPTPTPVNTSVQAINEEAGHEAVNTVDDLLIDESRWSGATQWATVTYDLGEATTIGAINLYWSDSTTKETLFDVAVSTDGTLFTTVYTSQSAIAAGFQKYDFADCTGRYVRIIGYYNTAAVDSQYISISELEILNNTGEKLNVSGVAANNEQEGNPAANSIDGNVSTKWTGVTQWAYITYDLGSSKLVSSVDIFWFKSLARQTIFDIAVSEDGTLYTTVFSGTSQAVNGFQNYALDQTKQYRYVRIIGHYNTVNNKGQWISIIEVKINTSELPTPTYTISIGTLIGGSIAANPTTAAAGDTITLTVIPDSGKRLKAGSLKYNDGTDHAITGTSFIMPAEKVTVSAEFEDIPASVSNADKVAADKAALNIGYAAGDNDTSVTKNLNLTVTGAVYGSTITWASSNTTVISNNGIVTRPSFASGDANVTVTATVYKSGASDTKSFSLVVLKLPQTTYTVTFNKNGGDMEASPATKTAVSGGNVGTLPTSPTRSGYTFSGWNTAANGSGTAFTVATAVNANLTVYAQWTVMLSNGDSYGGGGSSSGYTATTTTVTTNTGTSSPSVTGTTTAEAKSDLNGKAAVTESQIKEAVSKAVEAASKQGEGTAAKVVIKVTAPAEAKTVEASLPKAAVTTVANNKIDDLTVSTPVASITFDKAAINTILKEAADDVKIISSKVDATNLSEAAKAALGDRPVFNFSVISGDKNISRFEGTVTVAMPYTPNAGEDTNAIVIYYINAEGKPEPVSNCLYDTATGTVRFKTNHFSNYAIGYNKVIFKDVATEAWYGKAVGFVAARGIITGTGNGNYSPEAELTRGQFLVMVMRTYEISPDANPADNFADAGNAYYTGYMAAAKRLEITAGTGNNMFAPEKKITRQEMFTLLYNILKQLGELPTIATGKTLASYSDSNEIASWARDAMTLFVGIGAISGDGGNLSPTDTTNRAQIAQVLYNVSCLM